MKKLYFLGLILSFVFTFRLSYAENLQKVMLTLEKDTINILQGFLRNNNFQIIKSANDIANHPNIINEIYTYAKPERRTEAFKKYIKEFDDFVRQEAKLVAKYIKEGQKAKASYHFAKMIDRCNGCHAVFRGW